MRIEKREGSHERRILIGMIVDRVVLARIVSKWQKPGLFNSKWANIVGAWCVKFYRKYAKAPGKAIEGLFETWAAEASDENTVALVERFLESLSEEYETLEKESNSEYLIDLAAAHFNKVALSQLRDALEGDLDNGDIDKAQQKVREFGRIEMGTGAGINPLADETAIRAAFEDKREPLIRYPGALGNFFADALERDAFVAFMGPEKRGKTHWLLDIAFRGVRQGRRVAFFEVGDMSQNQILRRLMSRVAKHPIKPTTAETGPVRFPKSIEYTPGELSATVEFEEFEFAKPLSWKKAWRECQRMCRVLESDGTLLRLSCHPNSSLSVIGLQDVLTNWEHESGWVPDVVVIDYADILAPIPGYSESRDQVNATWKRLRAISQATHCLVVTATQTDAASYRADVIDRSNFSEDKRKLAHVTGMVGLNATKQEKQAGLMRLNWVVLREAPFSEDRCCHVAGCLDLCNPAIKSTF